MPTIPYPGTVLGLGAGGDASPALQDAVKAVQHALGVQETGLYGPTTQANVCRFQRGHGIGETGQVGPQTWEALFTPAPAANVGPEALKLALSYVGQHEEPIGSNRGPFVDECNRMAGCAPGSFWCLAFANRCFQEAANKWGVPNPIPGGACRYSCSALFAWARDHGKLVSRPQPGDIGLCIGGEKGHYHAVIVASAPDEQNRVSTVEGNSNDSGDSNGWEVAHRGTSTSHMLGRLVSSMHYVRL